MSFNYIIFIANTFGCSIFIHKIIPLIFRHKNKSEHKPQLKHTLKVLCYAPGTKSAEAHMISILQSIDLTHQSVENNSSNNDNNQQLNDQSDLCFETTTGWFLLPMMSSQKKSDNGVSSKSDLTSSSLGDKLADALERTRMLLELVALQRENKHGNLSKRVRGSGATFDGKISNKAVLFLGMDSPELPLEEIIHGLHVSSGNTTTTSPPTATSSISCKMLSSHENNSKNINIGKAHMCPANDGGYGLLSVPKNAPSFEIFKGVRWSNSLTAVSQLKALTDSNVNVSIGKLMHDVDEPEDVEGLAMRLVHNANLGHENKTSIANENIQNNDVLTEFSSGVELSKSSASLNDCRHTFKALQDLDIIQQSLTFSVNEKKLER